MFNNRSQYSRIIFASLVSQVGSHLLTLSLAAYVYLQTGSAVKAAGIFVISTLPATLLSSKIGSWIDNNLNKKTLIKADLLSIVVTILCGLCVYYKLSTFVGIGLLATRSVLSFISRTSALKWIKEITTSDQMAKRIQLFYLTFFISTALSGILAAMLLRGTGLSNVVYVDVFTYIVSIFALFSLTEIERADTSLKLAIQVHSLRETLKVITSSPKLCASFVFICLSQAIFQGAYTCLVTVLPMSKFNLGAPGTGLFQISASLGITIGFFLVWKTPGFLDRSIEQQKKWSVLLAVAATGSFIISGISTDLQVTLIAFIFLNCCFECVWLYHNSIFFRDTPKDSAARFQFTLSAVASSLMAIMSLLFSLLIDQTDLIFSTSLLAFFSLSSFLIFYFGRHKLNLTKFEQNL